MYSWLRFSVLLHSFQQVCIILTGKTTYIMDTKPDGRTQHLHKKDQGKLFKEGKQKMSYYTKHHTYCLASSTTWTWQKYPKGVLLAQSKVAMLSRNTQKHHSLKQRHIHSWYKINPILIKWARPWYLHNVYKPYGSTWHMHKKECEEL
jgi:hypothetical protein